MLFRCALSAALVLAVAGVTAAQAQTPFPPVGAERQSPFPPVGQQSSSPPAGQQSTYSGFGQPQQMPPCIEQFMPLREQADKRYEAAKAGIDKRGSPAEMCSLLTKLTQAQTTLLKFVEKNSATCPFPPGLLDNIKAGHVNSDGYRKQWCAAANAPTRPARAEPTLSDALTPPVAGKDNTSTGRGTLDSLFGNPLAR